MRDETTYVFVGIGSSMVLEPLANRLASLGHRVRMIDPREPQAESEVFALRGVPCVLITSDHIIDTEQLHGAGADVVQVLSVLDIATILEPRRLVWAPHDLVSLLQPQDLAWIGRFDLALIPDQRLAHLARILPTNVVGWPRLMRPIDWSGLRGSRQGRAVHFLSGLIAYFETMGFERSMSIWGPLYRSGVAIKLPLWRS
jgi:hypothetical protein